MYSTTHPEYVLQNWHIFVSYLVCTWLCCLVVLFGNTALPYIESVGAFASGFGFLISILICVIMPKVKGKPYASSAFVWEDMTNETGWSSDAFAFCLGMLNAAFAVGAPDIPSHLAEEMPRPTSNIPKAILVQYIFSLITGLLYLIAIFYATSDLSHLPTASIFPLADIYLQATGSPTATVALLVLAFIPTMFGIIGCYILVGRQFWTLARDKATPYPEVFSHLSQRYGNPFAAILLSVILTTLLGCIYVGSTRAFNDLVGSFVILMSLSYLAAILPHLLNGRKNVKPGWFWMKGWIGYSVNAISCAYLGVFVVIFCFPAKMPLTVEAMNYSSVIVGGASLVIWGFWYYRRGEYEGPRYEMGGGEVGDKGE